jgi:hypothetical protein
MTKACCSFWVEHDVGEAQCRDRQQTNALVRTVRERVRAFSPPPARDHVAERQLALALWCPESGRPFEDDEELLDAVVRVEMKAASAGHELVDRGAELAGPGGLRHSAAADA